MRRLDTLFPITFILRATLDFPIIGSNATFQVDVPASNAVIGMHVISNAPVTDASSLDDLVIQFMVVENGFIRVVLSNNSPGGIDPASIDWEFLFGFLNPQLTV